MAYFECSGAKKELKISFGTYWNTIQGHAHLFGYVNVNGKSVIQVGPSSGSGTAVSVSGSKTILI